MYIKLEKLVGTGHSGWKLIITAVVLAFIIYKMCWYIFVLALWCCLLFALAKKLCNMKRVAMAQAFVTFVTALVKPP